MSRLIDADAIVYESINAYASCPKCSVVMKRNFKGSRRIEDALLELIIDAWNRRAGEQE